MNESIGDFPGSPARVAAPTDAVRLVAVFVATSLLLKLALLLVDPQPRFYLGDSESYLATSLTGHIPRDRSWLYGFFAVGVTKASHGLGALLGLKTLAGVWVSASVGALATLRFGVSRRLGGILVIATSLEPMALYYERSVLTESFGLAFFWSATILLLRMADHPTFVGAVGLASATLLAVALRTAFVPHALMVVVTCLGLAFGAWTRSAPCRAELTAVVLVLVGLRGYAMVSGALVHTEPAINPRSGAFLAGLFAPILQATDFDGLGLRDPAALLAAARTQEPWRRNEQTFNDDGLFALIEREVGDWRSANRITREAAGHAVRRDPRGALRLTWANGRAYLDESLYRLQFPIDAGLVLPIPEKMVANVSQLTATPFDPAPALRPSFASRWLEMNLWVGPVLFVAAWVLPVLLFPVASWASDGAQLALRILCLVTAAYVSAIIAFSLVMAPRFLLPVVPCVAVLAAVAISALAAPSVSRAASAGYRRPARR